MIYLQLALTFSLLSLLAVGGGTAVLPEMQTLLLERFNISQIQFVHIYSFGQLAPGPNMLMVLAIGLKVAGFLGAAVVLLSFFIPSSLLCFWVGRIWMRMGESPWRRAIQNALEPISIGLMISGVYAVGHASIHSFMTAALAVGSLLILLATRLNPVFVILLSGLCSGAVEYFLH